MDSGMRNDIESTKRTLLLLRELSVDVGGMFDSIGFQSRFLDSTQEKFLAIVEESCITATTLQRAMEMHDVRALALLREMHEAEHAGAVEAPEAGDAPQESAPYREARDAPEAREVAASSLGAAAKA
jgi:hypothetical protein